MQDHQKLLKPHVIAFIDVMGTKEILKNQSKKEDLLNLLLSVHREEQKEGRLEPIENGVSVEANVTSFSDHIVISIPLCKNLKNGTTLDAALGLIQQHLSRLFSRALAYNFLIRGAIDVGELYHEKHMVFGQSLVDAYLNESKAVYPRIVLTDNCLAKRIDYNLDYGIPDRPNYFFELNTLDFNSSEPGSNSGVYTSANVFIDYDGTSCLRMVNTHSWHNIPDPMIDFKKSICKGKTDCGSDSYLKKNWIWLERYIEKETYSWQQFKKHWSSFPSLKTDS